MSLTPQEWAAVLLSLKVGAVGVILSLPLAVLLAYALARGRFRGKALLDALVHLPLVLPPVVTGYALLLAFGRHGMLGQFFEQVFGLKLAFRWTGAAVAAAVMGFPLLVRATRLSFEAIDRRLEVAARTLGGSASYVFFTISLPLALPGILAGSILSFARGLGEFGATITFVSNIPGETQTIPIAIYGLLQSPSGDTAAMRLSLFSIALSLGALLISDYLARRLSYDERHHDV